MSVITWVRGAGGFNRGFVLRDHKSSQTNKCTHQLTSDNAVNICVHLMVERINLLSLYKGVYGEAIFDLLLCIHYVLLC